MNVLRWLEQAVAEPGLSPSTLRLCEFCPRPANWDVETQIDGVHRNVWVCGQCLQSKMILHQMEVVQ